ncbi:MAG: helix-turn-helix domain-containing protein [Deltaproteobacteria bacterium]|nr:helix-turn-helix domain-containing protein [Deltaproteobacteria bacterium]
MSKFITPSVPTKNTSEAVPEPLLTEAAAAKVLALEQRTLEGWRATRRYPLPFIRIGHKTVRYRASDLTAFIEARLVNTAATSTR